MTLNSLIRKLGVLSMAGGVAAVPLIIALTLTGWGAPGTAAYQTYELLNRLMALSLLLMLALPLGIVGFGIAPFLGPAVLALALGWLILTRTSPIQVQSEVAI